MITTQSQLPTTTAKNIGELTLRGLRSSSFWFPKKTSLVSNNMDMQARTGDKGVSYKSREMAGRSETGN